MKADFKKWLEDKSSEAIPFAEDLAFINQFAEDFAKEEVESFIDYLNSPPSVNLHKKGMYKSWKKWQGDNKFKDSQ